MQSRGPFINVYNDFINYNFLVIKEQDISLPIHVLIVFIKFFVVDTIPVITYNSHCFTNQKLQLVMSMSLSCVEKLDNTALLLKTPSINVK